MLPQAIRIILSKLGKEAISLQAPFDLRNVA